MHKTMGINPTNRKGPVFISYALAILLVARKSKMHWKRRVSTVGGILTILSRVKNG